MRARIVMVIVCVVVIVLAVRDVPLGLHLARIERERVVTRLERDAYVLAGRLSEPAADGLSAGVASEELAEYSRSGSVTAIVVDSDGNLLAGSAQDALPGESYLNRPEIVAGLLGRFDSGRRDSVTLGEPIVYATVPIFSAGSVVGVIRLSRPASVVDALVSRQIRGLMLGGLVSVIIGVIAALLLARLLARPIIALRDATRSFEPDGPDTTAKEAGPKELRQLARSFNEMKDRVRRMLHRQQRFAGDAAHQLRTPLTALRLRLESASNVLPTSPDAARDHVDAAIEQSERLVALTEQMLLLARSEGKVLPRERFDLVDLVRGVADEYSALASEAGVELLVDAPAEVLVESSPIAWREILGNYVDNAVGHSSRESKVFLIVSNLHGRISVTVRDSGRGMSREERERAFDRFWRGAANDSSTGAGLGLAIVRQLAEVSSINVELRQSPSGGVDAVASL
jgi:signal transduction histidine kinase